MDEMALRFPNRDAVVYPDRGLRFTYREFNDECSKVAKGFLKMGIKRGDHVAIWATNYPEWLMCLFAAAKIGAVLVTVNTNYKIFELEYLLHQSDTRALFFMRSFKDTNYVQIVNSLIPEIKRNSSSVGIKSKRLPHLKDIVFIPGVRDKDEKIPDNMTSWDDIVKAGESVSDEELSAAEALCDPSDTINMQYTSGTTGFPKGVMLTHTNILNNGFSIGECMKFTENDRLCIPVPFFHCFGLVLAVMACLTHGCAMVPVEHFSPVPVMSAIQNEKCTAVHGVPTMFIFMLEHPDFAKYDFSSLRTGIMAGSPCPTPVMREVIDKMNMREITIAYGLTESSPVMTQTCTDDSIERRVETVGKPLPWVEVKVVDPDTGKDLPVNIPGEICCRGYNVMKGYYKMPAETAAAIDKDGFLHSGDLGTVDEDGYFRITGRIKDMIIRGGENIYPKEIEELIYTHPSVKDVQVVGVPSEKYGEEIMAYIIPREKGAVSENDIRDFVSANMARHKVPSFVRFVDAFPMTASGKIQKYKLRHMAASFIPAII